MEEKVRLSDIALELGSSTAAVSYVLHGKTGMVSEQTAIKVRRALEERGYLPRAALLIGQVIIAAFGEEIAYQRFFLGKGRKLFPFWLCAVVSSVVFAAGYIAAGNIGVVLYDVACVFIDSLIFSVIYRKSGNCVISTFLHILGNAVSLVVASAFF